MVYYVPRSMGPNDLDLMRRIDVLHLDFPFVGARMLRRLLRGEFPGVGRRRIGTLMLHMGITALCPHRVPAAGVARIRCTRISCGTRPSRGRTRSGRWTSRTSRWRMGSCTSPRCSTGRAAAS